ncbi:MAG: hypothetical protein SGARI_006882, partial [Bacillariaceae sp.]
MPTLTTPTAHLDAEALKRQDAHQNGETTNPHFLQQHQLLNSNNNNSDADIASTVSSTASEYGTVINLGNHEQRMKEIDELAKMMEEDGEIDNNGENDDTSNEESSKSDRRRNTSLMDEDETDAQDDDDDHLHIEPPPRLSNSLLHNDSGLDLPILESKSFDKPTALPPNRT